MPILFVLLIGLIIYANTLPGSSEGLAFYLKPDFSKITGKIALEALGQAFFSLSLGMGLMITYGSYLSKKEVKKIVTNVFSGDDEDFVTTTEKISECVTYKEATEILKGVFFTYRVSPYSKEAVVLTNAVSHFFRQA